MRGVELQLKLNHSIHLHSFYFKINQFKEQQKNKCSCYVTTVLYDINEWGKSPFLYLSPVKSNLKI